ncbi:MAG: purine-binding chemotaxis protein CheW [Planctomycetes bacterium]|nr:purine-binding chemotaxis protein CheW [Planctomycetota bacterium]
MNTGFDSPAPEGDPIVQLVTFHVADMKFGVNVKSVEEIILPVSLSSLPRAPGFLEGMINLRGRIIPILSMRKRFLLPQAEDVSKVRIIVVGLEPGSVGFLVDRVDLLTKIPFSRIQPAPRHIQGMDAEYLEGVVEVGGQLIILLDLHRVLSREEKSQLAGTVGGKDA